MINRNKDKWLVIINPNAGKRTGRKDWKKISLILKKNDLPFIPVFSEYPSHALEICQEYINNSFTKIISIGGDGTLNEIVNGIFLQKKYPSNKITLAAISIGTGNDWSKMYNIPKDYEKAIEVIKSGQTFIQDIGLVEYNTSRSYNINVKTEKKYFINAAGLGFDAEVVFRVNKKKKEGKSSSQLSYLKDLLLSLFSYKPLLAKITVDKNQINENIFSMSIGINKYSGGGMKQLPFAIPDDGLFDITIIKNISKPDVIKNIHRLYNGTIGEHPKVITLTGESIIVESDSNIGLETDGESLGYSPFKFSIIPRSLKVVVSNDFLQND